MHAQIAALADELIALQNAIAHIQDRLTILERERKPPAIDVPTLAAHQRARECRGCGAGHGCDCE